MAEDRVTGCEAVGGCDSTGPLALAHVFRNEWYTEALGRMQYLCERHYDERNGGDGFPFADSWQRTPPFVIGQSA